MPPQGHHRIPVDPQNYHPKMLKPYRDPHSLLLVDGSKLTVPAPACCSVMCLGYGRDPSSSMFRIMACSHDYYSLNLDLNRHLALMHFFKFGFQISDLIYCILSLLYGCWKVVWHSKVLPPMGIPPLFSSYDHLLLLISQLLILVLVNFSLMFLGFSNFSQIFLRWT